ncbi:Transmembrane protein [Hirschfeldia incana]|nr:Transmembrane protein [Hirschfeldia incana]
MTLLLLYCFFTSLSLAHGASTIHISPTQPPTAYEKTIWENSTKKFIVAETPLYGPTYNNPQVIGDASVALAAQRTFRKDPLNGFQKYTGGWNISNRHYWASVGYTAGPLFAVAAVWFLGFGICLLVICMCYICHRSKSIGYSRVAYFLSLIFLLFFTLLAIIGCAMLYSGQIKYNESTTETLAYVMSQADSTIGAKLSSSISTITDKATSSSNNIRNFLNSVKAALIVVSIVMLILTFLGLASSIFGMQVIVYTLVILGWILVTGTFILSGTFLLLHNATADTCVAMSEWVERPSSNTALDEILPCTDNATAQETLMRSKEVTGQLVELINTVVSNVSNINFSPVFPQMYYNQSGPLLPLLCNPFNHDLTDRPCSPGELDLNNATQAWSTFVCQVNQNGTCTTTGRLTPALYGQMASCVNISTGLINDAPFLVQLQDCSYAKQTFRDITNNNCPGLRRYGYRVYVGLAMLSTAVMLSLVFWIIYSRERRHRKEALPEYSESKEIVRVNF